MNERPTAACLIIGDEILTGKIHDVNSHVLAQVLFDRGVRLMRIETIPDDVEGIAEAVARLAKQFTWVFTSGGIGPTHDDKTYEGVARAFGRELVVHRELLARMEGRFRSRFGAEAEFGSARTRMATLPEGAQLWVDWDRDWIPLVVVANVHVLPGVPELFAKMVRDAAHRFAGPKIHRRRIYTHRSEGDIADLLSEAQTQNPAVAIGSYPRFDTEAYQVMVTLEGEDPDAVEALKNALLGGLGGFERPEQG